MRSRRRPITLQTPADDQSRKWRGQNARRRSKAIGGPAAKPTLRRSCRNYAPTYLTETNSISVAFAPTGNGKRIAVLQPFTRFAVGQFQRIRAAPGQFEHATARILGRSADRATSQEIAGLKIAAVDGVMSELLRNAPVKVLEIRSRDYVWLAQFCGLQLRFEMNVDGEIIRHPQIWQRLGILWRKRFAKRLERIKCHDPRRNARAKVFGQERTERLVFPRLNIACAPIVHQHHAKDVIDRATNRHWLTKRIARPNEECRFQFVIEAFARTKDRLDRVRRFGLTLRSPHIGATDNNRTGSSVISDRQPFPIWHERVLRAAQHRADIVRVVIRRIKIRVIADVRRQLHRNIFLCVKDAGAQRGVVAQNRCVRGQKILQDLTRSPPGGTAEREKRVERIFREDLPIFKLRQAEMPLFLEDRKIDNVITDRDANPGSARDDITRFENSEWQILNWKMRIGRDVDEGFHLNLNR